MRRLASIGVASAVLLGAAALAPVAQAAPCDGKDVFKPFLPWHDKHDYALVEDGSFSGGGAGWSLTGPAAPVPAGNTLLPDSSDAALQLGAGSSATSPRVCVTHGNPTARMFASRPAAPLAKPAHGSGGPKPEGPGDDAAADSSAKLKVEVLYLGADGARKEKRAAMLKPGESWKPTQKFSLAQGRFKVRPGSGGKAWIRLRFTPIGDADWVIDDVYVDPRRRI